MLWKCYENVVNVISQSYFVILFSIWFLRNWKKEEEEELKFNIDIFPIYIVPNQNRNENKLKREKANYNMAFGNFMI